MPDIAVPLDDAGLGRGRRRTRPDMPRPQRLLGRSGFPSSFLETPLRLKGRIHPRPR